MTVIVNEMNLRDTNRLSVTFARAMKSAFMMVAMVSPLVVASLGVMPSTVLYAAPGVGGTITTYMSGGNQYTVHTFTTSGSSTFTAPSGVTSVDYLIVGGGGGGGTAWIDTAGGSGGGGGELLTGTATVTAETNYPIVVGAGGAGGVLSLSPSITGQNGANGTASSAFSVSAGGGFGAIKSNDGFASPGTGKAGNSGGNQFTGANAVANGYCKRGGGGAGAGENGYVGQYVSSGASDISATGSKGGNGVSSSLRTGTSTYYGGGGGGAGTGNCAQSGLTAGSGGLGGGGNSATWNGRGISGTCCSGYDGAENTGGGGGGQSGYQGQGGNGGSGIVVIRYLSPQTVTWSPTTSLDTTDSPATPSALPTALGGATITYSVVSRTTSTCTVAPSTGVLTFTGSGNCVVRATAAATGSLQEASTTVTFVVSRVAQSVLTISTTTGTYGVSTSLSTTGGSGTGSVTYAVTGNGTASGCAVSGSSLSATSTGTCKITATKAADDVYSLRSSAETTITIARGTQSSLALTSTSGTVDAAMPITVTGGTGSGAVVFELLSGGSGNCTISGSSIVAKAVGTCSVKITKAADANVSEQSVVGTITFAEVVSQSEINAGSSTTSQPPASTTLGLSPSATTATSSSVPAATITPATTPTTSTTVSKTETASVEVPDIVEAQPGAGAVEINGELIEGSTSRVDNQLIVTAGSLTVGIAAIDEKGTIQPLDANGNVFVQPEDLIQVTATGFKTQSDVEVWMFSTPTQLGNVSVNDEGKITATFTVPKSTESGDHRIALVGTDAKGNDAKFAIGLIVGSTTSLSTTAKILIAVPIIGAVILALLLPTQVRRRRRRLAA